MNPAGVRTVSPANLDFYVAIKAAGLWRRPDPSSPLCSDEADRRSRLVLLVLLVCSLLLLDRLASAAF